VEDLSRTILVSNFDQMATAKECMQVLDVGHRRGKTDQFWQYAKEAMLSAGYAQTDEDQQGLFDLARTWTQAALLERASPSHRESPHKASAATGPGNRGYSQQIEGHAGNPGLRSCGGIPDQSDRIGSGLHLRTRDEVR